MGAFQKPGREERNGVNCPVFAVITRDATEELRSIHDRMPVILSREDVESWIKPNGNPTEICKRALTEVVMEKAV